MVEGNNGDAIVDLVGEGVDRVVHYHHVFHLSVRYYPQIFNVVAFWGLHTVLSVQAVLE